MDSAMVNGYINGRSNGLIHEHAGSHKMAAINSNQYMINQRSDDHINYDSDSDRRPHREMAIDVPENFIGQKKERPSYPPTLTKNSSPRKNPDQHPDQHVAPAQDATADEMQRIRKYQEDLRKRREEEERHLKEEEFLRTSMRGSKKLQSLEEQAQQPGFVNPTYEEDTESRPHSTAYPKKLLAVEDLFASLQNLQKQLRSAEDQKDVAQISKLFSNTRFQQALRIHNKMVEVNLQRHKLSPVADNSQELCGDVMNSLNAAHGHPVAEELRAILQTPNLKMLMYTHDHVATNRARLSASAPNEDDDQEYLYERVSQYNADSIKIVRLHKTAEPLGATVRNNGESVIVGRIVKGGAAEKSGLLHEGDEMLEINGIDIRGKSVNDVCDIMANMTGTLTFLIVPAQDYIADTLSSEPEDKVLHLRALFDYDPEDDIYIPCRELGISFQKRDILHVISQEDANWWQAYREGEDDQALAGLIPSKSFQEQREAMRQTIVNDSKSNKGKKKPFCHACRGGNKKKKQLYGTANDDAEAEDILTYEEVALYYPQPNRKRPIVLIGPPGVGRQELRSRLMTSDQERYGVAVPHTSRPPREDEKDGIDYHFVSRPILEQDIANQKFVEFGEYEKNLYGTSLNAIRAVVQAGKICILNLHPQSLRILKNSDLKPYIVFIAAPNIDKLRTNRIKEKVKFTEVELKEIIEHSRELEENYGHYFDYIIVNFDLDKAYNELLQEINHLEVEPQWVPAQWVL
uniref:Protein PALS1 n=1 Tax=Platynereis dumerilii TaxID=6359 RepID=A0A2H5BFC5_PLADU|nr:Pals1 [Platynereis dumerilii]